MKLLIGVMGENGAGKSSFAKRIQVLAENEISVEICRFSHILAQTLDLWGLEMSRRNLQELPKVMEVTFGEGVLSRAARPMVEKSTAEVVILDGVRWWTDFELIHSFPHHCLVYVTASQDIRFHRLKDRGEKTSEKALTREQFDREERAKSELQIPNIGKLADVRLKNEASTADFEAAIDRFYQNHIKVLI